MTISRTFTRAQLKTIHEVITLARTVLLIFKEWQPKKNVIGQLSVEKRMRER
jgi:uncharacterized protein (DUF486 family)